MENVSNNVQQKDYFVKREEKEKRLRVEQNKKKFIKLLKWLIVLIIAAFAIFGLYKVATKPGVPIPGESFSSQGQEHIDSGSSHPAYNSNPPSSGWHYPRPAQSGIYDTEFPDEQLIHNLEHGHIWIAYKPDTPKDQIELLANIAKGYGSKVIMAPRKENDTPIALVAWQHVFKLTTVDEAQIKTFIDAYRGRGPENIPDSGFKDFRNSK